MKKTWIVIAAMASVGATVSALSLFGSEEIGGAAPAVAAPVVCATTEAWPGVTFSEPMGAVSARDGTDRVFVIERGGRLQLCKKWRGGTPAAAPRAFLDVSTLLSPGYDKGHGGLISLALHPAFGQNGRFFLFYGTGTGNPGDPFRSVIAGYKTMPGNPDQGDPSSAQIILTQEKRNRSHPGGGLCFGPDGMLYVGFGDNAAADDPERVSQDMRSLEGKILRIDVTNAPAGRPYVAPADNPWPKTPGVRPEIFAYGVRNPFRMSFDAKGLLWMGDPGQKQREELDVVPRAGNLGWPLMESDLPLVPGTDPTKLVPPVFAYGRELGRAAIGGQVYRGQRIPSLADHYVFADHMAGKLIALPVRNGRTTGGPVMLGDVAGVSSIDEDAQGELYITSLDDEKVYMLVPGQ